MHVGLGLDEFIASLGNGITIYEMIMEQAIILQEKKKVQNEPPVPAAAASSSLAPRTDP
jgi:hypothetical protein